MRTCIVYGCFFLLACGGKNEKKVSVTTLPPSQTAVTSDTNAGYSNKDTTIFTPITNAPIKKPSGIYQFVLPYNQQIKIEHIIAFYNNTYRLQERYRTGKKDSVVIMQGTWAPSDGYIWLYKDQVVAGRYTWKGDTLQYFSPRYKKNFSMQKLEPAQNNAVLSQKRSVGIVFYGVGNEPFWSVELNKQDTVIFSLPEWSQPLKLKVAAINKIKDSTIYLAQGDSLHLRVVVLPYFCSDGMSDFVYSNKIEVQYNGKTYTGCGIRYK